MGLKDFKYNKGKSKKTSLFYQIKRIMQINHSKLKRDTCYRKVILQIKGFY